MIAALAAGVETLDVGGRVTFGIAESLRLGEGGGVGHLLFGHLGEDVVRRPVDDAHHPRDRFAAQALAQRPHDRDPAGHGGLEEQIDADLFGDFEELDADVGEQLLVGGDHRLAGSEGGQDQLAGRFDAADHLDHDVDIGITDDRRRLVGEQRSIDLHVAAARQIADGDAHDLQLNSGAGLDLLAALGDELDERSADVSAPEHTDTNESPGHRLPDHLVDADDGVDNLVELAAVEDRTLAAHGVGVEVEQPVDLGVAAPLLGIPVPGARRRPSRRGLWRSGRHRTTRRRDGR